MSFYAINPAHPHLGAAINLRVFPLAAALEVGFADIAEVYVFYGDGVWQQGHKMSKREGVFCLRVPQFTGSRLYLRFYLVDSKGQGIFVPGSEHAITYGQYSHLFADSVARPVEIGTYIPVESQEQVDALPGEVSRALRLGTESLWLAIGASIITNPESRTRLVQVVESVQRLPATFLEFPGQTGEMVGSFSEMTTKPWVKAVILAADSPEEALVSAEAAKDMRGQTTLVAVSPRNYLELAQKLESNIIPIGRRLQGLERAISRGITASEDSLAWVVLPDEDKPTEDQFRLEYAAATGVGYCFGRFVSASIEVPFNARPLIPDLALICPRAYLDDINLPGGFSLSELLEKLEAHGFLCSVVSEEAPWKARAAIWFTRLIPSEVIPSVASARQPVLILSESGGPDPGISLRSTVELRSWPDSVAELGQDIEEWFSSHADEQSSWVVIPGTARGEKR